MPVPELAPDPGQRVLHCHVNWVKTHLHNRLLSPAIIVSGRMEGHVIHSQIKKLAIQV